MSFIQGIIHYSKHSYHCLVSLEFVNRISFYEAYLSVVDCGAPGTLSNGDVSYTLTTESSTVVNSCDDGFILCGDENRTCLSTGVWSGSVPDCISEYISLYQWAVLPLMV